MNLVSNAIKFTAVGGVTLRLRGDAVDRTASKVRLRIADTGIGIPRDKIPLLFEPFYPGRVRHVAQLRRDRSGPGDLAPARRARWAAASRVRSAVGRGSVFTVRPRPRRVPRASRSQPHVPRLCTALVALAAARGKTVLLVEDNAVNAFISAASLESMGVAVRACERTATRPWTCIASAASTLS